MLAQRATKGLQKEDAVENSMTVRRELVLPVSPERAWAALTDPACLAEWFANEVELDLRPGGKGDFRWSDGAERHAVVEAVEPTRCFRFQWSEPDGDETTVAFSLDEVPGGTRLTVTESASSAQPQARAGLLGEWSWAAELLWAAPAAALR